MNQSQFADLCGITRQMASKYAVDGRLVWSAPGVVDARASLAALAGHLDEDRRQNALARLDFSDAQAADAPAELPLPPPPAAPSAKQEADALKRDLLRLELAEKAGQLVLLSHVEGVIFEAVSALRTAFDGQAAALAEDLTREASLDPTRTAAVRRRVKRAFALAQAAAAETLSSARLLADAANAPDTAPETAPSLEAAAAP